MTSFQCANCRAAIPMSAIGTKHRNHCPLCLWSKHLDMNMPGDRKSSCGARMKPVGLQLTDEIMLVHECLGCGKISTNRIAGDDDPEVILSLLQKPKKSYHGITLLTDEHKPQVHTALFGK